MVQGVRPLFHPAKESILSATHSFYSTAKPELWPQKMSLPMNSFSSFNMQELQNFIKARAIPLCGFFPVSSTTEGVPANNEKLYRALFMLLQQRNVVRVSRSSSMCIGLKYVAGCVHTVSIHWPTAWARHYPVPSKLFQRELRQDLRCHIY